MMKRITAIAFLIVISTIGALAQTVEQQAAKIRRLYEDTNKRIEAGLKDQTSGLHYAAWTIGGTSDGQQWRAVGAMKTTDEFWFDGEPGFDEGQAADARKTIRRIVSTYANGSETRNRSEYLFTEAGELVFAYAIDYTGGEDGSRVERRFYFSKNKLIRAIRNGKTFDGKFASEDSSIAAGEQQTVRRLQNRFALMFAE